MKQIFTDAEAEKFGSPSGRKLAIICTTSKWNWVAALLVGTRCLILFDGIINKVLYNEWYFHNNLQRNKCFKLNVMLICKWQRRSWAGRRSFWPRQVRREWLEWFLVCMLVFSWSARQVLYMQCNAAVVYLAMATTMVYALRWWRTDLRSRQQCKQQILVTVFTSFIESVIARSLFGRRWASNGG